MRCNWKIVIKSIIIFQFQFKVMLLNFAGISPVFQKVWKFYEVIMEKTNFIIIFMDDMGYGDMGCYGTKAIRTPVKD